jgi:predicted RNA-binding protein
LEKSFEDKKFKYWIHRIDENIFSDIAENLILGSKKHQSRSIKNIKENDFIILYSNLNNVFNNRGVFISYTQVDDTFIEFNNLYDYYNSKNKLKLRGMKYFAEPIPYNSLIKDLEVFHNVKNPSSVFKSEYREISSSDFHKIKNNAKIVKKFPSYLKKISFNMEDFILKCILNLYNNIKCLTKINQMEISNFIELIVDALKVYGVETNYSFLEEFYSNNIWKLKFKHVPSRNPDKFVTLYSKSGKGVNFGYISFE